MKIAVVSLTMSKKKLTPMCMHLPDGSLLHQ